MNWFVVGWSAIVGAAVMSASAAHRYGFSQTAMVITVVASIAGVGGCFWLCWRERRP